MRSPPRPVKSSSRIVVSVGSSFSDLGVPATRLAEKRVAAAVARDLGQGWRSAKADVRLVRSSIG